ncbi:DUF4864 domain-containing protein [Oceaniradius stylonematis]|uniref:DUF4864 domain-containing protein n=2 Tax=Oceaniradius stylonematis TaxID=2184161 RepID=A0A3A8AEW7_9HYPH|nr:DUF4864 domain-containing protein [Oceaniradius stylonematis]
MAWPVMAPVCPICRRRASKASASTPGICQAPAAAYFSMHERRPAMTRRPRFIPLALAAAATMAFALAFLLAPLDRAHADENAARNVITEQLESFLARDFERAYGYASQDIKRIYPTLDGFMSMVERGYLPVLRPGNYAFGRADRMADGRIIQEVLIRAPDGSDWTAVYYMELQDDGTWRVDGVNLRKGAAGLT